MLPTRICCHLRCTFLLLTISSNQPSKKRLALLTGKNTASQGGLEAVNLNEILLDQTLFGQELQHILALVTLQLNHLQQGGHSSGLAWIQQATMVAPLPYIPDTFQQTAVAANVQDVNAPAQARGHQLRFRCNRILRGKNHSACFKIIRRGRVRCILTLFQGLQDLLVVIRLLQTLHRARAPSQLHLGRIAPDVAARDEPVQ